MTDKTTPGFDTAALYFTDRLLDALADVERFPLTLIEAPMGYGKTLAVRHWLHGRTARQVWVSTLGASEDAFWRDFCVALARAFPDNEDVTDSLLRLGYPTDTVRLDAARELVLRLDLRREPCCGRRRASVSRPRGLRHGRALPAFRAPCSRGRGFF